MQDGNPYCTPEVVYPYISKYAKGKVFCDLGSGKGRILSYVDTIAKEVIGVENCKDTDCCDEEFFESMSKHTIYKRDFKHFVPSADVYYMWVGNPQKGFEQVRDKINGILLVGANCGTREIGFVTKESDEFEVFRYNKGVFLVGVFNLCTNSLV